jgi:hypothetical protein
MVDPFIERWQASGAAERANYGLFLLELCDGLGVERPKSITFVLKSNHGIGP